MILSGGAAPKPSAQPAFTVWSQHNKAEVEQALKKLDADAFKLVKSVSKKEAGTDNCHYVINALPQNLPNVQKLILPLMAAGMRVELPGPHGTAPANGNGFQLVQGKVKVKGKGKGKGKLATKSKAGLAKVISKAKSSASAPAHRVHGQCDHYTANEGECPRGNGYRFACYNGPATN